VSRRTGMFNGNTNNLVQRMGWDGGRRDMGKLPSMFFIIFNEIISTQNVIS